MSAVVDLTCLRHRLASFEADRRIAWTACGLRVALVGRGCLRGQVRSCRGCAPAAKGLV